MIGVFVGFSCIPLNAELNPICHLLALLGGATIVVVSRLRVKYLPLLYTEVQCLNSYTLKPLCFSATLPPTLAHHATPLPNQSPVTSTLCLQHCPQAVSGLHNNMNHLLYDQINNIFF